MLRICDKVLSKGETTQRERCFRAHLINALQVWAQASVYAEHSSIYDCSKGQIVKYLATPSPDVTAPIFSLTFVVEAIYLGDLSGFVVATDEGHAIWIAYFEGKQE